MQGSSAQPEEAAAADLAAAACCQYPSWYPRYARHAIRSVLIELPAAFEQFLQEDGVVVEDDTKALPTRWPAAALSEETGGDAAAAPATNGSHAGDPGDASSSGSSSSGSCSGSSSDSCAARPGWSERFPGLVQQIDAALQQLRGPVAPALNWSSPTDATWISSSKSLKCCSADEVLLLLKCSDRVQHDLDLLQQLRGSAAAAPHTATAAAAATTSQPREPRHGPLDHPSSSSSSSSSSGGGGSGGGNGSSSSPRARSRPPGALPPHPAVLVLREWFDLRPECELRCFVRQHRVAAVCQRDVSQHFPQLQGRQQQLAAAAVAGHRQCLGRSFPLDSYAADLYLAPSGAVRLLNINPICSTTSPLLYSWEELPYRCMHDGVGGAQAPPVAVGPEQPGDELPELPECRVVEQPGLVQAGTMAATGMPYDMLHVQESLDGIIRTMQRQHQSEP